MDENKPWGGHFDPPVQPFKLAAVPGAAPPGDGGGGDEPPDDLTPVHQSEVLCAVLVEAAKLAGLTLTPERAFKLMADPFAESWLALLLIKPQVVAPLALGLAFINRRRQAAQQAPTAPESSSTPNG